MATTREELEHDIRAAVEPGFRQRLLARGQSRAMIWRDGVLPDSAPEFSPDLSDNLLSYGYSLLLHGVRYLDINGDPQLARIAFEVAAEALEAVAFKGEDDRERDFHRLVAAAAYHLGRYSARAYSLLHGSLTKSNLSTSERAFAKLMLRDLDGLASDVSAWFSSGTGSDDTLQTVFSTESLEPDEDDFVENNVLEGMNLALEENFLAAMSQTLMAHERGDESLSLAARERLRAGLDVAGDLSFVTQWWLHRLAIRLIGGLWDTSFHAVLPRTGPLDAGADNWALLRKLFISSLYQRGRAEIELWPSQLDAAKRVLEFDSNLVLSLPTSAGKTRIAELCILACLAKGKRVIFVTPLRALSAQTELGLRRTFAPLGKTVSSLYGSIGASGADVDALRTRDIVVATPEKLDFALRSDPTLLQDVGLVVLDEGHMIGLNEREIRYEAQIQRLLRRSDATERRIVCLSAILPEGDQLHDFAGWLTCDKPDGLIKNNWRPTRLRYGEVDWRGSDAQLNIVVGDETPFVPKFIVAKKPTKKGKKKLFPSDQTELCIATAWRLMQDDQTVLVFCPLRVSVLPFARCIIDMHDRGHIDSVLDQPESILATALAVGAEWFGPDHEILACLKLGVAVHHGELPTPYRKEIERLLRDGVLKLTVSSPTLAQGLNLAATSLIFHGTKRRGKILDISEFRNVVGRAGRAYIDVEGLVLYPMFDDHRNRRGDWKQLADSHAGREMESGLLRLVAALLIRMRRKLGTSDMDKLLEFVTGEAPWDFPQLDGESERIRIEEQATWEGHLTNLDTAIFSLLGEATVADDEIEAKLDEVLASSLFKRRLARHEESTQMALTAGLAARAKYIWSNSTAQQRRGYFLAGVGLTTGHALDAQAEELNRLLMAANAAVMTGQREQAVTHITAFAAIAFNIPPFTPGKLMGRWRDVLRLWLMGAPLTDIGENDTDAAVSLIEHAFVYNLPWAMEAVRVRAEVHEDMFSEDLKLSDFTRSYAVPALETGTMSIAAAMLIQAGFGSRLGAIKAVESTGASFDSMLGLLSWLASDDIQARSTDPSWPTSSSHEIWVEFAAPTSIQATKPWEATEYWGAVKWHGMPMPSGMPLRFEPRGPTGEVRVFTADYQEVGTLGFRPNLKASGLTLPIATGAADKLEFEYIGPDTILLD
ncbi:DEAD/DEAH box helicase [Aquabacterium sp.]|uniref:DEAD/DEAH box helicase n=1 Tax=Aquabacterium sp. TaxID=1872578 RepID=UPI002489FD77|nr:DEAD/DEAH box helicase [Aquabacterium sp.]MDI1259905.1 DEAD/DEAH box helicase [Aquabacterium sp.]